MLRVRDPSPAPKNQPDDSRAADGVAASPSPGRSTAMRAFAVTRFGQPPAVVDLPKPESVDTFLIRVTYAGVNPVDYKMIDGLKPDSKFPHVVGIDFAGELERVPNAESSFRTGDRVVGMAYAHGSYAEFTTIGAGSKPAMMAQIPD